MTKQKVFLYTRKSTDSEDKQVMSLEAQLFELREFARKENLEILEEFQESKSAKIPGRAVFNEMMSKVEEMGDVGILAWHPDRLARNSIDGGRIIYAVDTKKLVSLHFSTFWFEPTPQGLFMLQVAFGQSKYYSDSLAQNVKRGYRQKARRGEWLTRAPFGYVNNREKRNIEPHPVKSKIIVRAYEEYAKGTHGLVSLADFLAEHGVTTGAGTPLGKASVKRILTNRAYLGFTKYKDEWFDGSFALILSSSLFEDVQKVLASKGRPQKRNQKHNFPFANLFRCEECSGMFTAQWATGKCGGKYRYYRCTKKKGKCSQGYIREEVLASQLKEQLQTISLSDVYTDYLLAKVNEWEQEENGTSQSEVQCLADNLKENETRMDKLVSTYLDSDIEKVAYIKQKDKIMRDSLTLKSKLKDTKRGRKNWVEPLREWVMDTKQATFLSSSTDLQAIRSFVQKIGTNPRVLDKTAHFSVPSPCCFVATRRASFASSAPSARSGVALTSAEVSFCDLTGNRTPICAVKGRRPSR